MLSKTSISAIRTLLLLAGQNSREAWSPRRIAQVLDESPTYLAKVVRHLVKAGILESEKGVKGGVRLAKPADEIRLLHVVEACQGTIVGDYCRTARSRTHCAFHQAAAELHQAITGVLGKWTLAALLTQPSADTGSAAPGGLTCLMAGVPPPLIQIGEAP